MLDWLGSSFHSGRACGRNSIKGQEDQEVLAAQVAVGAQVRLKQGVYTVCGWPKDNRSGGISSCSGLSGSENGKIGNEAAYPRAWGGGGISSSSHEMTSRRGRE